MCCLCKTRLPAAGAGVAHTQLLQTARKPSSVPNKLMNYPPPPNRLNVRARSRNRSLAASESLSDGAQRREACRVSRGGAQRCLELSKTSLKINSSSLGPSIGPSPRTRRVQIPCIHTAFWKRAPDLHERGFAPWVKTLLVKPLSRQMNQS